MKRRYEIGNMFWFYYASICTDRWERTWVIVFMSQGWVRAEGDVHEDVNQNLGLFRQPLPYNIHVRGKHDQTLYHHLVTKTHIYICGNFFEHQETEKMTKRLKGWGIFKMVLFDARTKWNCHLAACESNIGNCWPRRWVGDSQSDNSDTIDEEVDDEYDHDKTGRVKKLGMGPVKCMNGSGSYIGISTCKVSL